MAATDVKDPLVHSRQGEEEFIYVLAGRGVLQRAAQGADQAVQLALRQAQPLLELAPRLPEEQRAGAGQAPHHRRAIHPAPAHGGRVGAGGARWDQVFGDVGFRCAR